MRNLGGDRIADGLRRRGGEEELEAPDSLLGRDGRIARWNLRVRLGVIRGALSAAFFFQLAFLEFGELFLTLLESIIAFGHRALSARDGPPGPYRAML
ncbi:MAG TPA: hypothetical protein VLB12_01495 [Gemmatimonadales bacterium]|nr:hypothetical protein [Gemmatimonadales bacterium]